MKTAAFLADILSIFQRYHRRIQSNDLTLLSLAKNLKLLQAAPTDLKEHKLIGGWEEHLDNEIIEDDGEFSLKGIQLSQRTARRIKEKNDFGSNRKSIIQSTIDNLLDRFDTDFALNELIEPFINFQKDADIREIHNRFASDLSLFDLSAQYKDLTVLRDELKFNDNLLHTIQLLKQTGDFEDVVTVFARIAACTYSTFSRCRTMCERE